MPKYHLRYKNLTNVKKPDSGKYIKQCSCVNYKEWSSNEIYQLVNVKKSTSFVKNIIKKMRKYNLLSQFSNMFCMLCSVNDLFKLYRNYNNHTIFTLSSRLNNLK